MSNLPPGWVLATISTVASWGSGGTPSATNKAYYGGSIPWAVIGDLNDATVAGTARQITESGLSNSSAKLVAKGTILIAMYGSIGKLGIAGAPMATNQAIAFANPNPTVLDHRYLFYFLRSQRQILLTEGKGATQQNISQTILKAWPIPLAPLSEQERIVAAIEEQFSRLDAGVAALERARQNLKRMRAAVLQAAVATAEASSPEPPHSVGSLLAAPLANGRSVPDGPPGGFPVLRLTAVRKGRIDAAQAKVGAWTTAEAAPFTIKLGDFLVVRGNGSKHLVGRGGLVTTPALVAYPDTLIRIRFDRKRILPEYGALLWDSFDIRRQIESVARTTAGIYKINQQSLADIRLPIPSIVDQRRIVGMVDEQLTMVDKNESTVSAILVRSNILRAALLSSAFSGKLVPQDPTDEPAVELLERMAAHHEVANGRKYNARPTTPKLLL